MLNLFVPILLHFIGGQYALKLVDCQMNEFLIDYPLLKDLHLFR